MQTALLGLISTVAPIAARTAIATGNGPDIPWFRLFLALAFCLLVAWGVIALMRHRQMAGGAGPLTMLLGRARGRTPPRIRVIETRRASQHGDLCLVECDGQLFFLALSANGAVVLQRHDADGERAS